MAETTASAEFADGGAQQEEREARAAAAAKARPKGKRLSRRPMAELFSPGVVCVGLALGCNLSWVMMAFQSLGLFHSQPDPETVLDNAYLISIVASVMTYLAIALFHRRFRAILGTRAARAGFPLGVAASTVIMHFGTATSTLGWVCIVGGGVLSGVFTSLFMMHFGVALSMMRTKLVVAATTIGYALSVLLYFLYLFFRPLEATVFCASMAPIAGVLLAQGANYLGLRKVPDADPLPEQTVPTDADDRKQLRDLVVAFSGCMLLTGYVFEMARTIYVQVGQFATSDVFVYAIVQGGMAGAVTIAAIGVTLAILSSKSVRAPEACYRVFVFFLVLSALLLQLPLEFPDSSVVLPLAVNVASFQCLNMMMWALVCGVCNQYLTACVRTFALFRAAWATGPLVGMLVGRWLYFDLGYTPQSAFCASGACVLLLFAMSNFLFTEAKLSRALNILPIERKRRFQDKCRVVIERYGLTEREGEIMTMFAKGRNLPYIMDELVLSKSTVSTHRQHIYKKLGVHSSQEMIDLIQRAEG